MNPIIQAECLSRFYGVVLGLNNVSFRINPGITGIVGPNGAGKTTLFRLLLGQIKPSSGTIKVLGQSPWNNPEVQAQIAYCPEDEAVPHGPTATASQSTTSAPVSRTWPVTDPRVSRANSTGWPESLCVQSRPGTFRLTARPLASRSPRTSTTVPLARHGADNDLLVLRDIRIDLVAVRNEQFLLGSGVFPLHLAGLFHEKLAALRRLLLQDAAPVAVDEIG